MKQKTLNNILDSIRAEIIKDNIVIGYGRLFKAIYGLENLDYFETLSPREREILEMRFGLIDGIVHTLEETGQVFGVTRERIRHVEAKALEKLQKKLWSRHPNNWP